MNSKRRYRLTFAQLAMIAELKQLGKTSICGLNMKTVRALENRGIVSISKIGIVKLNPKLVVQKSLIDLIQKL